MLDNTKCLQNRVILINHASFWSEHLVLFETVLLSLEDLIVGIEVVYISLPKEYSGIATGEQFERLTKYLEEGSKASHLGVAYSHTASHLIHVV